MTLTIGGSPETAAETWNDRTYQEFGEIIYKLTRGDRYSRHSGYTRFYEFRNKFVSEVFDNYMDSLEVFRKEKNIKSILEILDEIKTDMVKNGIVSKTEPVDSAIPALNIQTVNKAIIAAPQKNEAEQLSLF